MMSMENGILNNDLEKGVDMWCAREMEVPELRWVWFNHMRYMNDLFLPWLFLEKTWVNWKYKNIK